MALWFKPKYKAPLIELSYDKDSLQTKLTKSFTKLYDYRDEMSYRIVLDQLQTLKNLYILEMGDIKPDSQASHNIAAFKGGIKAMEYFQKTMENEFRKLKIQKQTQDETKGHATKIVGKRSNRSRPSI